MEVRVKDIYKSFKGIECISDVNFTVYADEIVGVLAPRGSGKTLLLNLLLGKFTPDSGSIDYVVEEKSIHQKDVKKYIGYLDAENPLYDRMTVYDYLAYMTSFYKLPYYLRKERVRNVIKSCGKPEIINLDQGSQYTCNHWIESMNKFGIRISMDGKGRATDNIIYIERFFRTIKYDYIYLSAIESGWELYRGIKEFIEGYNKKNIKEQAQSQ